MDMLPTGRTLIDPDHVLEEAGIRLEMKVADLGVGAVGHFLFPAAKAVGPSGHIFAVDILPSVLEACRSRAKMMGLDNIDYIWGDLEKLGGTKLPDHSMDMALLVNVVHLTLKGKTLEEVKRILGTDGTAVIVDWKPSGGLIGPSPDRRVAKETVIAAMAAAGLDLKKEFEAGKNHYGLVFTKPAT
jgi:ubiquinone/menaquinone biosynthesis C-methylase UbiE